MKKLLTLVLFAFLAVACDDDESPAPTKTFLLTSETQKDWNIHQITGDELCPSSVDNTWTFFEDGSFTYDHGTITEDETGECGDLVNITGTWEFTENETVLIVVALYQTGNPSNTFDTELVNAEIDVLTDDSMILTRSDNSTTEFRKK